VTVTVRREPASDDAALLRRIGQGDQNAMAAFYREHGRVVLAQVLLVTGERVLAEEIVQDTMLAVWRGAGSFRGESSVRSWVIAIARRQTRDRLRGHRLRVVDDAFLADQPGGGPGPEVTALDRAELAEVTGAIRELAPLTVYGDTVVTVPHASLGQLQAGATTIAFGYAGPGGRCRPSRWFSRRLAKSRPATAS
jgi:RNA polymerase sigma factor (sigma-70 family)